jgi:serine/threonine-protein kinase
MRTTPLAAALLTLALVPAAPAHAEPTMYVKLPGVAACEVTTEMVVCESTWPQAPVTPCPQCREVMHMDQALVDAGGNLTWRDANVGQPDQPGGPGWFVLEVGRPYHGYGWTVVTDGSNHYTFTNDATGHGMTITRVGNGVDGHSEAATF